MKIRAAIMKVLQQERLNFVLTNRIPRRAATRFMGWFSKIEQPVVRDASLRVWRFFSDLDLSEAEAANFRSMHDCFTRRLKAGARPIDGDPRAVVSPCDAIVGAAGTVARGQVLQVKGLPYALRDLLADDAHADGFEGGQYVTLRLTSSMYHRFHAPYDCAVESVTHIAGDRWNVNPATLARKPGVFCENERAVVRLRLSGGQALTLVPVAAILVAGIRLSFMDIATAGPRPVACDAALAKGQEMGWFEHGSTVIVLAPPGFRVLDFGAGQTIRMGERLMWMAS
jgi:phosphatidylserine decarboxylase